MRILFLVFVAVLLLGALPASAQQIPDESLALVIPEIVPPLDLVIFPSLTPFFPFARGGKDQPAVFRSDAGDPEPPGYNDDPVKKKKKDKKKKLKPKRRSNGG